VGHFLPRPWSWLIRIVANIALLPSTVLRDAGTVVAGVVPGMRATPAQPMRTAPMPTTPQGTTPAATDPTATLPTVVPAEAPAASTTPTTPMAPLFTVEVPEAAPDGDLLEPTLGFEPTSMRYPAPKRSMAKKRR